MNGQELTRALREGMLAAERGLATIAPTFQEAMRHLNPLREWGARTRLYHATTIPEGRRRHGAVKHARDELRRLRRQMR